MAIHTTGSGGLAPEMKTFYDRLLLKRTMPTLVFAKFGQKRNIPRNGGKIIEFRKWAGLAVAKTPLTEGALYTNFKDLTVTAITATVAQYGDAIQFSDLVLTTTIDPFLAEATEIQGEQAAETIDEVVRDVVVAGTNVMYAGGRASRVTLTAADTFIPAEVRKAVLLLKLQRAGKIGGKYHCVAHTRQLHDLTGSTEWVTAQNAHQTGRIFDGSVGELYGVVFWETDKVPEILNAGAGATVDVYQAMFFGANAYGVVNLAGQSNLETITKQVGSSGSADALNQQGTHGWKAAFVAKILNDAFMLRVETAASTATNV